MQLFTDLFDWNITVDRKKLDKQLFFVRIDVFSVDHRLVHFFGDGQMKTVCTDDATAFSVGGVRSEK